MQIETRHKESTLIVALVGDWALQSPLLRFAPLFYELEQGEEVRVIAFDVERLGKWDSSLLTFLLDCQQFCEANTVLFKKESLPENIAGLIDLSQVVPEKEVEKEAAGVGFLAQLGSRGISIYDDFVAFLHFSGSFALTLAGLFTFRVRMRWKDFWVIIQANSSGALPIVTLISFLVGVILAFLGAVVLRSFGADYYVSYVVSYGVLRELGALMTAIIMAGRTGAAFAAELGSMKISEEISALETFGIQPMEFLVLPRVLSIFLMMPLLTIYANFVGLFGGLLVAISMLDVSVAQFLMGILEPVTLNDVLLGLIKATVYGGIIGLSGCLRGLQTGKDAGAVGVATTSAVVTAITHIIVANAIIDWVAAVIEL